VGRHSSPNGAPRTVPRRALLAGGAVIAALAIAVIAVLAMSGDDGTTTAKRESPASSGSPSSPTPTRSTSTTATSSASVSPSRSASPSPSTSPSASASSTKRPLTLDLRLTGDSFVTVRAPGGHLFLTKLLHKGDHRTFDEKTLVVVLGNAAAVEVRINGKLRPRGGRGQVAKFVAARK
jgi:cytoskeletal protein RodZ